MMTDLTTLAMSLKSVFYNFRGLKAQYRRDRSVIFFYNIWLQKVTAADFEVEEKRQQQQQKIVG